MNPVQDTARALPYFNSKAIRGRYGVCLTYAHSKTTVHYEMECVFTSGSYDTTFFLQLHRTPTRINGKAPGGLMALVESMSRCLYPVTLDINPLFVVTGIDHFQVKHRVELEYGNMRKYYSGEKGALMLRNFRRHVAQQNRLMAGYENSLFYQLMFHLRCFPSLAGRMLVDAGGHQLSLHTTLSVQPEPDAAGNVVVTLYGNSMAPAVKASVVATYTLFPEDFAIASIDGTVTYADRGMPRTMRFEVYRLNRHERTVLPRQPPRRKPKYLLTGELEIIEVRIVPKRKSFWRFW